MSSRHQRISPIVAGIIAGAVIAIIVGTMAWININFAAPWARSHTLTAQIVDADGIGVSSDVRIAGRLVGQITSVRSRGAYSDVTFHVDSAEWPLPQDTTASIRLATLLGQKYLQLEPGTDTAHKYQDDAVIPQSKTKDVVDFDQILKGFDPQTRGHLTSLIRTLGGAVNGQEGTVQVLVPDLRQLAQDSTVGLRTLAENDAHVNSILVNLGTVADTLNTSRDDLAGLIDNFNSVTGALATHQDALRGQIRNGDALNITTDQVLGNGGAQQLLSGLQHLNGTGHQLDRLLTTLIPQTQSFQTADAGGKRPLDHTTDLVYRIGDATSQSDNDGFFLRQYLQSVDTIGLTVKPTAPGAGAGAAHGTAPILPLPTNPLPVPIPPLPGLNGILPGGNGSSGGGGGIIPPLPLGGIFHSAPADGSGASYVLAGFVFGGA